MNNCPPLIQRSGICVKKHFSENITLITDKNDILRSILILQNMNRSFALEEYHSRYSYQKYIRNFRSYFISYITYERADEPVSGFGFNILSLKLFIRMIQSIRSISGISAKQL